jgi:hypothetical protein
VYKDLPTICAEVDPILQCEIKMQSIAALQALYMNTIKKTEQQLSAFEVYIQDVHTGALKIINEKVAGLDLDHRDFNTFG